LYHFLKKIYGAPGWLSCQASALGSGHDPRVVGCSPALGSLLNGKPGPLSAISNSMLFTEKMCHRHLGE